MKVKSHQINHCHRPQAATQVIVLQAAPKPNHVCGCLANRESRRLGNAWSQFAGGTPRSQLRGVHELGPGSSLTAPGSGTSVNVGPNGAMDVNVPGRRGRVDNLINGLFQGLGSGNSCFPEHPGISGGPFSSGQGCSGNSMSPAHHLSSGGGSSNNHGMKMEPGAITTRTGQRVTYSTPGAIVLLPDGSSVATGRGGGGSSPIIRNVAAGPGSRIPTSPPGATTVFRMCEDGRLERLGLDNEVLKDGAGPDQGPQKGSRSGKRSGAKNLFGALKGLFG